VNIERIEAALERHAERFLARSFTPAEIALADARPAPRRHAGQALGRQGSLRQGAGHRLRARLGMKDIEVVSDAAGAPSLVLQGAAARLARSRPQGMAHVFISHSATTCHGPVQPWS
jgi:holo-[acyl-carrier protein] synthase